MTVSNFLKTDKETLKWFILHPHGHEGPYSLLYLEKVYKSSANAQKLQVWAVGLETPIDMKVLLFDEEEQIPDLPPLPSEEEQESTKEADILPSIPVDEVQRKNFHPWLIISALILIICVFGFYQWVKSSEKFTLARPARMEPDLHQKILNSMPTFEGWSKRIFFREYTSSDMSRIWMVTSSFQKCDITATFQSIENKILSKRKEEIQFNTYGQLKGHIAEFSKFEFIQGSKIIPGYYEMDIEGKNCKWDGITAQFMNGFVQPADYQGRQKVILYHRGPEEFSIVLDKLIRKNLEEQISKSNQEELFWQDLSQKFQTLLAVSIQIEQNFSELIAKDVRQFSKNLDPFVATYTKNFGNFLTSFVVENEKYFKSLDKVKIIQNEEKKNYEVIVRNLAKRIGLSAMKVIEAFQKENKTMKRAKLNTYEKQLKTELNEIKTELNRRITLTSPKPKN